MDAKHVVRPGGAERDRSRATVDRGRGAKTVRRRAGIPLRADRSGHGPGWADARTAGFAGVGPRTVTRVRKRSVEEGFGAAACRKPSAGRPCRKPDGAGEATPIAAACGPPPEGRARRAPKLLADRLVASAVVEAIGCEAVGGALEETTCGRTRSGSGSSRRPGAASPRRRWRTCWRSVTAPATPTGRWPAWTSRASGRPDRPARRCRRGPARRDHEYERAGTADPFVVFEPPAGRRRVEATDRRTRTGFAGVVRELLEEHCPQAGKAAPATDDPDTHSTGSLHEASAPRGARRLAERLEVRHTPEHGSRSDTAETEPGTLTRECPDRRIADRDALEQEAAAWRTARDEAESAVDWRFTTADARVRLERLYPSILT